jgi:ABC-type bacteriocin/lantibiotic exporter with double-glycine peptidase domain
MIHDVPQYSQHLHIETEEWQNKSCGIASLGMLLAYHGMPIPLSHLLAEGLLRGAYLPGIGWKHKELVELARVFGGHGENFDWASLDAAAAFEHAKGHLAHYPILASIHRQFDPHNGGHLIVLTGIDDTYVYYNDPDVHEENKIAGAVSIETFLNGWKKRIIAIYPPALADNSASIV